MAVTDSSLDPARHALGRDPGPYVSSPADPSTDSAAHVVPGSGCEQPTPEPATSTGGRELKGYRPPCRLAHYTLAAVRTPPEFPCRCVYHPRLLGFAETVLTDRNKKFSHARRYRLAGHFPERGQPTAWATAEDVGPELQAGPPGPGAVRQDVPAWIRDPKRTAAAYNAFIKHLYDTVEVILLHNRSLNMISDPDEPADSFLARCRQAARASAQPELEAVRARFRTELGDPLADISGAHADRKLLARWQAAAEKVYDAWQRKSEDVKEIRLTPRRADIRVTHFGIGWAPFLVRENDPRPVPLYERVVHPTLNGILVPVPYFLPSAGSPRGSDFLPSAGTPRGADDGSDTPLRSLRNAESA